MTRAIGALTVVGFLATASLALAQADETDAGGEGGASDLGGFMGILSGLHVHGFVSQGFILSFENSFLAESLEGSFEFTEVGLNFTAVPVENLRLGIQLFTRDLGPLGNYAARFDWFYADYRLTDALGIRVGRTKLPFGLYNELQDVDVARVPVLLPQSVYPTTNRDFLLAQTGVELYGLLPVGSVGYLDYRLYGGTVFVPLPSPSANPFDVEEIRIPYVVGGRLLWETPRLGLRVGGSVQALRLESELVRTELSVVTDETTGEARVVSRPSPFEVDIPAILWVVSAEVDTGVWLLALEYSRWHLRIESTEPALFPERRTTSERAYAMLAWRATPWLQPGVYYSVLFPDVEDRSARESRQHDVAVTLRFDLSTHWLLKVEGHYMNGTALVNPRLNEEIPRGELSEQWGVLLLKTTAYF
jgi:hypothetical protein